MMNIILNYKQNYFAIPYFKVTKLGFISHFIHYVYFDLRKLSWRFKYTCDSNLYYVKYYYLKYLDRESMGISLILISYIKRYYYLKDKSKYKKQKRTFLFRKRN